MALEKSTKLTIGLALITLVGTLATGLFSNWDKIFQGQPEMVVKPLEEFNSVQQSTEPWVVRKGLGWERVFMQAFTPEEGPRIVSEGIDYQRVGQKITLSIDGKTKEAVWPVYINMQNKELCVPYPYPSLPVVLIKDTEKLGFFMTGYCKIMEE